MMFECRYKCARCGITDGFLTLEVEAPDREGKWTQQAYAAVSANHRARSPQCAPAIRADGSSELSARIEPVRAA